MIGGIGQKIVILDPATGKEEIVYEMKAEDSDNWCQIDNKLYFSKLDNPVIQCLDLVSGQVEKITDQLPKGRYYISGY